MKSKARYIQRFHILASDERDAFSIIINYTKVLFNRRKFMPGIGNPLPLDDESVEPAGESTTDTCDKALYNFQWLSKNMLHAII